ncbi:MAG: regulatory iron-sulfur-containing complex subunit RicT [Treponemataceae bacterium]|nr:MAG: regulatory iron-sulfur-containing complex subunit RicT [Treponemataceae bacterium]
MSEENKIEENIDSDIADISRLDEDSSFDYTDSNEVELKSGEKIYRLKLEYANSCVYAKVVGEQIYKVGSYVIAPTRYGNDMVRVAAVTDCGARVRENDIVEVIRAADEQDMQKAKSLKEKEAESSAVFIEKVRQHRLDIKLICVHYLLDENKALFFFSSDKRIDFRELVKDLVSVLHVRIELRQIAARDEPRLLGGAGICGRTLCCYAMASKLRPVSIHMAKDQNLSLNSVKISGQCGKLLCCLAHEQAWYAEAARDFPPEGLNISYMGENFRITGRSFTKGMIQMTSLTEEAKIIELKATRFTKANEIWAIE